MTEGSLQIAVIGPGGVGAYFGGMLARAGHRVTMIGRPGKSSPHLEAIARDGLRIDSFRFDERVRVAVADGYEALATARLVLFAVKAPDTEDAARTMRPHIAEDAIVVGLQNGVDNAERMRAVGVDPVESVVFVAAAVERPGEVKHRGRGDLIVGHPERRRDAERVAAWFEAAGVGCVVSDDVRRELWVKLIINSGANATSALTGATYGTVASFDPTREVAVDVAREGVAVAAADGVELDFDDVWARCMATWESVGAATASTEQDIRHGRPTEIDALNGYIARRGAALDVPTPVNRALWALVKLREIGVRSNP